MDSAPEVGGSAQHGPGCADHPDGIGPDQRPIAAARSTRHPPSRSCGPITVQHIPAVVGRVVHRADRPVRRCSDAPSPPSGSTRLPSDRRMRASGDDRTTVHAHVWRSTTLHTRQRRSPDGGLPHQREPRGHQCGTCVHDRATLPGRNARSARAARPPATPSPRRLPPAGTQTGLPDRPPRRHHCHRSCQLPNPHPYPPRWSGQPSRVIIRALIAPNARQNSRMIKVLPR
jgi:hypothetical protein